MSLLDEILATSDPFAESDEWLQCGITGRSGASVKSPSGKSAKMKGDKPASSVGGGGAMSFNALHPRYPAGHPQGGKFMPKGGKDFVSSVAKSTGKTVAQVKTAISDQGGEGKVFQRSSQGTVFGKRAGAVGKAQKILKDKSSTPEQRAKAKATIAKAAAKTRDEKGLAPNTKKAVTTEVEKTVNTEVKKTVKEKLAIAKAKGRFSKSSPNVVDESVSAPTAKKTVNADVGGVKENSATERKSQGLQVNNSSQDIKKQFSEWNDYHRKNGNEDLEDQKYVSELIMADLKSKPKGQKVFGIKDSRGKLQSLISGSLSPEGNKSKGFYIDNLATAPWNMGEDAHENKTKGAGARAIAEAAKFSKEKGFGGVVTLESLPSAAKFYEYLGFTQNKKGKMDYTLSAEAAEKLLKKYG